MTDTKTGRAVALALALSLGTTGCFGSFGLTGAVYDWNDKVTGSIVVKEILFLALIIIPVYEVSLVIDAIILNFVEFLTGTPVIRSAANEGPHIARASGEPSIAISEMKSGVAMSVGTGRGLRGITIEENSAQIRDERGDVIASAQLEDGDVVVTTGDLSVRYDAAILDRAQHAFERSGAAGLVAFARTMRAESGVASR